MESDLIMLSSCDEVEDLAGGNGGKTQRQLDRGVQGWLLVWKNERRKKFILFDSDAYQSIPYSLPSCRKTPSP